MEEDYFQWVMPLNPQATNNHRAEGMLGAQGINPCR